MTDSKHLIPGRQRKADAELLTALEDLKASTNTLSEKIDVATENLYRGEFNADEHETLRYETSKLKLIYSGFEVAIKHIEACQDTVALVFEKIYGLEERHTAKYWWSRVQWLNEAGKIVLTIAAVTAILKGLGV